MIGPPLPRRAYVGMELGSESGTLYVTALDANSPAARAGVCLEDRLLAVAGTPVTDLVSVRRVVAQLPVGTASELTLRRNLDTLTLALVPASAVRVRGQAAQPSSGVIALKGGTIVTVTRGTIENGTIVMRDGKIAAVGANVAIPAGADVIDHVERVDESFDAKVAALFAHRSQWRSTMGIEVGSDDEEAQTNAFIERLRNECLEAGALVGGGLGEAFKRMEPL